MSGRITPALIALLVGAFLAGVLFMPYVARQYRRRGTLGPGHAVLAFGFLVYGLALLAYTLLPLPTVTPDFCEHHGFGAQLDPGRFLDDIRSSSRGPGFRALLSNPAVQQVVLNVGLFVPLGMFLRRLFSRGVVATVAIGACVSTFIELTQLTGDWFLYPCAYRLFDVDDIIANTAGTFVGVLLAPMLALIPGQRIDGPPGIPRPVTIWRRWLGMLCDWVALTLVGGGFSILVDVLVELAGDPLGISDNRSAGWWAAVFGWWVPGLLLYAIPALLGAGGSVGQRTVLLRPARVDGSVPSPGRRGLRVLAGSLGFAVLGGIAALTGASLPVTVFTVLSVLGTLFTQDRRGLSSALTGLVMIDARSGSTTPTLPSTSLVRPLGEA